MRLVLTQLLAGHWLLAFALVSATALGADGALIEAARTTMPFTAHQPMLAASPYQAVLTGGVAIAAAMVAAMFLWALLMLWLGEDEDPGEAHSIVVLAHACAMIAVTAMMTVLSGLGVSGVILAASVMVAALSASYAAVSYEWRDQADASNRPDLGQAAARMMALGAAHSTVLSNITGRGRSD